MRCEVRTRGERATVPAALGWRLRRRPSPSPPVSPTAAAFINSLPAGLSANPTRLHFRIPLPVFRRHRRRIGWRRAGESSVPLLWRRFSSRGTAAAIDAGGDRAAAGGASSRAAAVHRQRAVVSTTLLFPFLLFLFTSMRLVSCWSRLDLIKSQRVRRSVD